MAGMTRLQVGSVFAGQFRVLRPLGEGGMGALYVVEQVGTGRARALKVMHPQFANDVRGRERFAQEAQVGARIESEHVVEVIGAGIDDATGTPWLAMELLTGETLAEAVARRGPLATNDVHEVFRQLCHAIAAAHRAGIVHRDLKPENIFLARARRSDARFVVKVLDFGIAKWIQDNRAAATATSAIGSPFWMAPEQFDQRGRISPATDAWGLGLIAFYLLTGQQYWHAAGAESFSLPVLVSEIVVSPIEPASQRARALGVTAPALGPAFDAWFARCVNRDPGARFTNAADLVAALPDALADVAAAPGSPYELPPEREHDGRAPTTDAAGAALPGLNAPTTAGGPPPPAGTQPMHTVVAPAPVDGPTKTTPAPPVQRPSRGGGLIAGALALAGVAGVGAWWLTRPKPEGHRAVAACPGEQHASAGHCCARGEEWVPSQGACVCIDPAVCGRAPPVVSAPAGEVTAAGDLASDAGAATPAIVGAPEPSASPAAAPLASAPDASTDGPCVGRWSGVEADRELRLTLRIVIDRASGEDCGRIDSTLEYLISPVPTHRSSSRLTNCSTQGNRLQATQLLDRSRDRVVMRCTGSQALYSAGVAPVRMTRR